MDELRRVAEWAAKVSAATHSRDQAILRARDHGFSLRNIAEYAGLSHTAVANIVQRGSTDKEVAPTAV